ncbi:Glutamate 5-kinase [Cystobasidiomycetes sp. EMM_F5]
MRNPRNHAAATTSSTHNHDNGINNAINSNPPESLTIVLKLGTSSIVNEHSLQPQLALLSALAEAICTLRKLGHRLVLVSSGAIGMGLKRMDMARKPKVLAEKQALAAIGQGRLIALWDNLFSLLGQPIAQVLLTRSDISDVGELRLVMSRFQADPLYIHVYTQRSRYLNSTKTLAALLNYGVVPIVNENDTVSVSEIKFGDNDTLSAITAGMVQADYLFLFTDVDCLYTANPRRFPETAKPVQIVRDIEAVRASVSTATLGSSLGTGGMETKLIAAELATGAGVATVITHGARPSAILDIVSQPAGISDQDYLAKTPLHTVFLPQESVLSDRRWWVLFGLKPRGRVIIDEGAYRAIARTASLPSSSSSVPQRSKQVDTHGPSAQHDAQHRHRSASTDSTGNGGRLLPAGVLAVEGVFAGGQAVTVVVRKRKRQEKVNAIASTSNLEAVPTSQSSPPSAQMDEQPLSSSVASLRGATYSVSTPEQSRPSSPIATHQIADDASKAHEASTAAEQEQQHVRSSSQRRKAHQQHRHFEKDHHDEGGTQWEEVEFGRGLANYNSLEIDRIKGHKSSEIESILGYIDAEHCVESITSLKRHDI